jgi:hypothetical protein
MVVQSAQQAKANASAYGSNIPGMCLKYVRTWLEIPALHIDAIGAWNGADHRHPGDRSPLGGAPCFWRGGSSGHGHIELTFGSEKARGTDMPSTGQVTTQDIEWVERNWHMTYLGWTEDLNGVWIPYLRDGGSGGGQGGGDQGQSAYVGGKVYVNKLKFHTQDSDSVGRLCYRLRHHQKMPGTHVPPNQVKNYSQEIVEAVRYWQRNIAPNDTNGPTDGESMSNQQANRLFGENYTVIEK